jgi:protein-disulfide isomerase
MALVVIFGLALAAVALITRAPAPDAHDRLSIEPRMTKGSPTAPVTIVEFSDYQ